MPSLLLCLATAADVAETMLVPFQSLLGAPEANPQVGANDDESIIKIRTEWVSMIGSERTEL